MARLFNRPGSPYHWIDYVKPGVGRVRESTKTKDKNLALTILGLKLKESDQAKDEESSDSMSWAEFRRRLREETARLSKETRYFMETGLDALEAYARPKKLASVTLGVMIKWSSETKKNATAQTPRPIATRRFKAVKRVLRYAEERNWRKPPERWDLAKPPFPEPPARKDFYTLEQTHELFRRLAGDPWALTVAMLGYYTTMRRAEMYWIDRKGDIDFEDRRIWFNPKPDAGWFPKGWKDGDDVRWVAMPPELERYLKRMKPLGERWLFYPRHTLGSMTHRFGRALKRVGMPGFMHLLRHTSLTHLAPYVAQRGLQDQAGHLDPRMTAKYTKWADEAKYRTAKAFPRPKNGTKSGTIKKGTRKVP